MPVNHLAPPSANALTSMGMQSLPRETSRAVYQNLSPRVRASPVQAANAGAQVAQQVQSGIAQSPAKGGPVEVRSPYESELKYFREHPEVAGMAAEDDRVILNPYSGLTPEEYDAVRQNETYRVLMRRHEIGPEFDLTEAQQQAFQDTPYANDPVALRQSIVARILSGDPSAQATETQVTEANRIKGIVNGNLYEQALKQYPVLQHPEKRRYINEHPH
jgi:hypothetical protein